MSKKKIPIPKDIAAKILFDSDRTCCVCQEKDLRIQIHHIDENPANNNYENLAVLCFDCHWETQIRGGFDRKLDANQVLLYKEDWISRVKLKRLTSVQEESTIPPKVQANKDYIEYEVIQDSIYSYSNSEVLKNSGYFVFYALVVILSIAGVAGSGLYFSQPLIMFLTIPIVAFGGFYLNNYRLFIKILFLPQSDEIDRCVDGKYVHKGSDGNYTVYEKKAMCILPRCEGVVKIYNAPPRERHKHGVIGRCSVDPNLHTYTVDFNGTGFYKEFDFRPTSAN